MPRSTNLHSADFESVLMKHYLNLLQNQPKPQGMSETTYITCLTLSILEQMGNKFPSQVEIDIVECNIKRYSLRKSIKFIFKQACPEKIVTPVALKAA